MTLTVMSAVALKPAESALYVNVRSAKAYGDFHQRVPVVTAPEPVHIGGKREFLRGGICLPEHRSGQTRQHV